MAGIETNLFIVWAFFWFIKALLFFEASEADKEEFTSQLSIIISKIIFGDPNAKVVSKGTCTDRWKDSSSIIGIKNIRTISRKSKA